MEKKWEKRRNYFWQKDEADILHDENFDSKKLDDVLVVLSEREWFPYLLSVLRNMRYKLEERQFLHLFFLKKLMKWIFDIIFRLKCSLRNPCTIYETMDSVFCLGSKKFKYFWQKNEGVLIDERNFVGTNTSLHPCFTSWGRTVSISIFSFEKYALHKEKILTILFITFIAQKLERKNLWRHF